MHVANRGLKQEGVCTKQRRHSNERRGERWGNEGGRSKYVPFRTPNVNGGQGQWVFIRMLFPRSSGGWRQVGELLCA